MVLLGLVCGIFSMLPVCRNVGYEKQLGATKEALLKFIGEQTRLVKVPDRPLWKDVHARFTMPSTDIDAHCTISVYTEAIDIDMVQISVNHIQIEAGGIYVNESGQGADNDVSFNAKGEITLRTGLKIQHVQGKANHAKIVVVKQNYKSEDFKTYTNNLITSYYQQAAGFFFQRKQEIKREIHPLLRDAIYREFTWKVNLAIVDAVRRTLQESSR